MSLLPLGRRQAHLLQCAGPAGRGPQQWLKRAQQGHDCQRTPAGCVQFHGIHGARGVAADHVMADERERESAGIGAKGIQHGLGLGTLFRDIERIGQKSHAEGRPGRSRDGLARARQGLCLTLRECEVRAQLPPPVPELRIEFHGPFSSGDGFSGVPGAVQRGAADDMPHLAERVQVDHLLLQLGGFQIPSERQQVEVGEPLP